MSDYQIPEGGMTNFLDDDLDLDQAASVSPSKPKEEEKLGISQSKLELLKKMLVNIRDSSAKALELLSGTLPDEESARIHISQIAEDITSQEQVDGDTRVVEGVFDGENMVGSDGKQYGVPANYASKSKLVEGDILKLTITGTGTFLYKQIGPIERARLIGEVEQHPNGNFYVSADGRKWRVLTASVTYFKGSHGDEAVILVPKNGESKWAAVENVVRSAR